MSKPLKILFADDQVPWPTDEENKRAKEEIRRELRVVRPDLDVDTAFAADYKWFTGLLGYLEQTKGEVVVRAPTYGEARQLLLSSRQLDVAFVDLSWWGDYTLPPGRAHRHNRGLELLAEAAQTKERAVPIVALSQEFHNNFELISTILERGALPVPKNYEHPKLGYRALHAAAKYLTAGRVSRSKEVELFISHATEDRDLAARLVNAVELGLHVPKSAIRCTSVPGYDYDPGTDFVEGLKEDLKGARCVVGLQTPASAMSQWCLFELGAAWGLAHKTLFLSLGNDAMRDPPAGFRSIQASRLEDADQLRRFLKQIEQTTGWEPKDPEAAVRELDGLAKSVKP